MLDAIRKWREPSDCAEMGANSTESGQSRGNTTFGRGVTILLAIAAVLAVALAWSGTSLQQLAARLFH
jgi:hypothetical protein